MGYYGDKIVRRIAFKVLRFPPKGCNISGFDLSWDMEGLLPNFGVKVVFDVGANVGQSTEKFVRDFPGAIVHSFEPADVNYRVLSEKYCGSSRVVCYRLALGSKIGTALITIDDCNDRLRIIEKNKVANRRVDPVQITTLDCLCSQSGISRINLLKIDVEGLDLDVLKGAAGMLDDGAIDLIQVEAGMNVDNKLHVPLREFMDYLEPKCYRLFRIYDQVSERSLSGCSRRGLKLRRCNPVFISDKINM